MRMKSICLTICVALLLITGAHALDVHLTGGGEDVVADAIVTIRDHSVLCEIRSFKNPATINCNG